MKQHFLISPRRFLSRLPLILIALLVGGCSRHQQPGQLNLLAWSEYVPQEVIDGFSQETGIKVSYATYSSNEEMLSKLLAGGTQYDLIQPSEYAVEALIREKKLEPIDINQLTNLHNIDPAMLHLAFDPDQKFSVPYMTGTVGICINTDKVKTPVKDYADVFTPEHSQRIVVVSDSREIVTWAMEDLGLDINHVDAAALAQVKPLLVKWIPMVKVFDSDSPKTALLNGDVDLGVVYSGDAAYCYEQDHKFQYVLPAHGAHRFVDTLAIPAGAAHKHEAELFMNYILRPEVSMIISDKFPYTNPNLAARKLLTPAQLSNPASYPADTSRLDIFHDIGAESSEVDKLVTDLRAQYHS
jgi:spermidine/putrescine transport system permease protein